MSPAAFLSRHFSDVLLSTALEQSDSLTRFGSEVKSFRPGGQAARHRTEENLQISEKVDG